MERWKVAASGVAQIPHGTKAKKDFDNFSAAFSASWDLTEEAQVYAKYSEGYKSGGFQQSADSLEGFSLIYDAEELTSYEIGIKSRWLDNRLQLNAAWFLSDYDDLQLSNFIPSTSGGAISITDNAGEAEISGVEIELIAQPTPDLNIMFNIGFLDPDYERYDAYDAVTDSTVNVAHDREHPFVADYAGALNIEYDIVHADWGVVTANIDYSFTSDFFTYSASNSPSIVGNSTTTHIDSYELVNARLTVSEITLGDGMVTVSAWGKNLTDEKYYTHGINFGAFGFSGNHFGDPRTYGVAFTYEF